MAKLLVAVAFVQLLSFGASEPTKEGSPLGSIFGGAKTAAVAAVDTIDETVRKIKPLLGGQNCEAISMDCPNENITFWYYSRKNPEVPIELSVARPETFQRIEKNGNPWKVIIHGYTKSKDEIPNPQLRSAYLRKGDYNLISVDYAPLARDFCYIQSVKNVPGIATCVAQLINHLAENGFFQLKDLHVIGFSLGAQIAGAIHENLSSGRLGRVTGLDPASPLFDGEINKQISPESGDFVDVIHTNSMFKGEGQPLGHVDFYANGGLNQPGCLSQNESLSTCSHDRSPMYFAESINSNTGFFGIPCSSYLKFYSGACDTNESELVLMGEYVPFTARGKYFLQTNSEEPFAKGRLTKALAKNLEG